MNKRVGWVQDSLRACGSTQKPSSVTDRVTCKTSGSFKLKSILEAVNSVCDDAIHDHVWVSDKTRALQEAQVLEAMQYDIEISGVVQRGCCGSLHQPAPTTTC